MCVCVFERERELAKNKSLMLIYHLQSPTFLMDIFIFALFLWFSLSLTHTHTHTHKHTHTHTHISIDVPFCRLVSVQINLSALLTARITLLILK